MKKQLNFILLAAMTAFLLTTTSCDLGFNGLCEEANGADVEQSIDLETITDVELNISASVYIEQGTEQSVEIHGKEDAIDRLELDVVNGLWAIEFPNKECMKNHELKIYITVMDINSVKVSGSGDVYMDEDTISLDHALEYNISGSGRINALLDVTEVNTKISGSGDLNLAGLAGKNDITVSGSGKIKAFDLVSTDCEIKVSGSGDTEVYVDGGLLDVKVSGSGKVSYKGTPGSINMDISGSGDVIDAN
jgi:hypothetical protein